jgi:hypothetical protein
LNNKGKEITVETHSSKNKKITLPILIYLSSYIIYEKIYAKCQNYLKKAIE